MKLKCIYSLLLIGSIFAGCKDDFLNEKPSSAILTPTTLNELKGLLEISDIFNKTGALPQLSADEYIIVSEQNYLSLPNAIQRNAYVWNKDLYDGAGADDWNIPFQQIFYANSVIDVLDKNTFNDQKEANATKGWAHFVRAYAYYDLARNFCKVYNSQTALVDFGLPIRVEPGVDVIKQRSSLAETFGQIIRDLDVAGALLDAPVPPLNKNRPSKAAVMALKARIYLYMGDYGSAEIYSDSTLLYHNKLIDFNSVSTTSETPFSFSTDEVIYQSNQIVAYSATSATGNRLDIEVIPELYNSFASNDLRKLIFFKANSLGKINMKRGYIGSGVYQFTGLATDEIYLIKAECLAWRKAADEAMRILNLLLVKRYKNTAYLPLTANTVEEALQSILQERRKELIWRGLRWSDLKRLNRDGANITLTRTMANKTYTLLPNDPRYVFPIPDQEILISGIEQN